MVSTSATTESALILALKESTDPLDFPDIRRLIAMISILLMTKCLINVFALVHGIKTIHLHDISWHLYHHDKLSMHDYQQSITVIVP